MLVKVVGKHEVEDGERWCEMREAPDPTWAAWSWGARGNIMSESVTAPAFSWCPP